MKEEYKKIYVRGKCDFYTRGDVTVQQTVKAKGLVYVDNGTVLNERDELYGGEIYIGKHCSFARDVLLQAVNHKIYLPALCRSLYRNYISDVGVEYDIEPIRVGNDVWIGARAMVLPGVTIGNGAIIGGASVVTKDVDPYSITAGNPAIHRKWRFPEHIIKQLQELKWWNWSIEKIRRNKKFFETNLNNVKDINDLIV